MTDTTGLPPDAELIRLLRARVRRLEGAIGAYLDGMREIGTPVMRAWDRYDEIIGPDDTDGDVMDGWQSIGAFLQAYRASLPKRHDAIQALHAAAVDDFRTAVLADPDMTDAQRAHWVALCDAEGKDRVR